MFQQIHAVDAAIMLFIQNFIRCDFLNSTMTVITKLGDSGIVWILFGLALVFSRKHRKAGILTLLSLLICFIANDLILKNLVMRPRPFDTIAGLEAIVPELESYSFPSGHACSSFAGAYALTRGCGKKAGWVYVLAVLIAISRPYVGVHYVTDILAGALIGTALSATIYAPLSRLYDKTANKKSAS